MIKTVEYPGIREAATHAASGFLFLALGACADGGTDPRPNPADAVPPAITISSPAHGAMLTSGTYDPATVTVSGEACHESSPITSLTVNGANVAVSGDEMCESFSVTVDSPWGMTPVTVVARNALGREATHVQAFLRSPRYFAPRFSIDAAARDSTAALVRITPQGLNKIQAAIVAASPPFVLGTSIPDPIANTEPIQPFCVTTRTTRTGYRINHGTVSASAPQFDMAIVNAPTVRYQMLFPAVSMPLTVIGYSKTACEDVVTATVTGTVSARVTGVMTVNIGVVPDVGGAQVRVGTIDGLLSNLTINLNLDAISFLSATQKSEILAVIAAQYESSLRAEVAAMIRVKLGDHLGEVLESMVLGTNRLEDIGLRADFTADALTFRNSGVLLAYWSQVFPESPRSGAAPAQGSIRTAEEVWPIIDAAADISYEVSNDMLNQIFWAAWQGGLFDAANLTADLPAVPGLSLSMRSLLPPVVMRNAGAIRIGWGDIQLTAMVDPAIFGEEGETSTTPVPATAYANVTMEAQLGYDSIAGTVVLDDATIGVTVGMPNVPGVSVDVAAVRAAIRGLLVQAAPEMLGRVVAATPIAQSVLTGFANWPADTRLAVWLNGAGPAADFHQIRGVIQNPASP